MENERYEYSETDHKLSHEYRTAFKKLINYLEGLDEVAVDM